MSTTSVGAMAQHHSADVSRQELQARLDGLGNLNGKKMDPATKAKKLREACEGFESVFIQKMWQEMRNTLPKGGLLQGREEKFWQDMYDQELSKSMTKAGGIGLADMMYEQLSRNLVSASRSTAGMSGQGQMASFMPSAAPLLAQASGKSPEAAASKPDTTPDAGPDTRPDAKTENSKAADSTAGAQGRSAGQAQAAAPAGTAAGGPSQPHLQAQAGQNANAQPQLAPKQNAPAAAGTSEPVLTNPVIEQALADLRRQQGQGQPAALAAHEQENGRQSNGQSRHQGVNDGLSGLQMAQRAQRDAGDKLAPGAVRPPLAAPRQTRMRYQTNMPEKSRTPRAQQLMQAFNANNANSRAGEGLAAYHQSVAQAGQPAAATTAVKDRAAQAQAGQMQAEALQSQIVQQLTGKGMSPQMMAMQAQNSMNAMSLGGMDSTAGMSGMSGMGLHGQANPLGMAGQQMALQNMMAQAAAPTVGAQPPSALETVQRSAAARQTAQAQAAQANALPPLTAQQAGRAQSTEGQAAGRATVGADKAQANFSIPPLTAADARG